MKTYVARQCSIGLAAGLILSIGCAKPKAEPPRATATPVVLAQAVPATAPTTPPPPVAPNAPTTLEEANAATAAVDTNAPAIVERIPASANPDAVSVSTGLAEVVKLAQAGVSEEVLLAYVEKYSGRFEVGAEQILYLNDLGVSSAVITAMLKHDGADPNLANTAVAQAPAAPQQPNTAPQTATSVPVVTAPHTPPAQIEQQVTTTVAPPPTSTEVTYFYDALSPYGSWVYLSGYGWCWQPTVAVAVPTWRPYCDRGRWYWSDAGWYWNSDYSWGWAAFHYGRWYRHAGSGWVWRPGLAWAPSWVSWRYYDGYCGWAPLPPEAHFVHGSGFTYYGRHVSVGFDFGLVSHHYTFVGINNFCDYSPYRHVVPHTRVQNFYRNTTVVNNYVVGNNRFVNNGIGRDTIARASNTRLREVTVRDTPVNNMSRVRGDRVERQGDRSVVYRPQLPKDPPRIQSASFATRNDGGGRGSSTVARRENGITTDTLPNTPRAQTGRGQSSVAARPNRNDNNDATVRPQPNTTEGGRPVTNQRGNPGRAERNNGAGAGTSTGQANTPSTQVGTARPQRAEPQTPARPAGQTAQPTRRNNGALFDTDNNTSTATTPQPRNNNAAGVANPRGQVQGQVAQPNRQNQTPPPRAYTQTPQPRQDATTQVEPRGQGAGRNYSTERNTMPPRQVEQVPRYTAPNAPVQRSHNYYDGGARYQAPVNAQPSHPAAGRGQNSAPQNPTPNYRGSQPSNVGGNRGGNEGGARSSGNGGAARAERSSGNSGGGGGGAGGGGGGGGGGRVERNR